MDDLRQPPRRRAWRVLAVSVLLMGAAGGGIYWWMDGGRHLFSPKNWGVVEDGLVYRSGRIHRRLIRDTLADRNIQVVVDLAGRDVGHPDFAPERQAAKELGIEHHTFDGLDGQGLGALDDYLAAFDILIEARRAGRPILVHCGGGSERTGAAFAWYRMLVHGWDGARAWEEYLRYRGSPPVTDDQRVFVNRHMREVAEHLRSRGLLDALPDPLPEYGPAQADAR